MKSSYLRIFILLSFFFSASPKLSAESVFVDSGVDILNKVIDTKYVDEKPVLFFNDQQEKDVALIEYFKNFIFKDSCWQDLVIKFAVRAQDAKIKREDLYEVYLDVSGAKVKIPEFMFYIDGAVRGLSPKVDPRYTNRKFVKLAEVKLGSGEHVVRAHYVLDEPGVSEEVLTLFLVRKELRLRVEKIILEKLNQPQTEICYILENDSGEIYVP